MLKMELTPKKLSGLMVLVENDFKLLKNADPENNCDTGFSDYWLFLWLNRRIALSGLQAIGLPLILKLQLAKIQLTDHL